MILRIEESYADDFGWWEVDLGACPPEEQVYTFVNFVETRFPGHRYSFYINEGVEMECDLIKSNKIVKRVVFTA